MKALFIGGTGNISTKITKLCADSNWQVTLLHRGGTESRLPDDLDIEHITCDINGDINTIKKLIAGRRWDVTVNFINYKPEQIQRDIRLFKEKTGQYIFISSASVYQRPLPHYKITEGTSLANPYWEYSRDKIACENVLMEAYRLNGFPATIVRPSHTYGICKVPVGLYGTKGTWQVIKRMKEGKPILVQGDGTSLWTLTHSIDFAKGFLGIMGNIHAIGEAVHITSDESITWNQVYKAIGNTLGVKPNLYHVSADFVAACVPRYYGPLHGDKIDSAVFDNSKIKRLVPGFNAAIRYDTGIRWSLEHMLTHPEMQTEDPEFDFFTEQVIKFQEEAKEKVLQALGSDLTIKPV